MNKTCKRVLFLMTLALMAVIAEAQTMREVVYLKDGSIVKGTIIEQIPNTSLKIQTADGSIFAYQMKDIEKITKEAYDKPEPPTRHKIAFDGKGPKTGYRGFADLGYTIGTGTWGEDRIEISTSHGYQFNPYVFAGAGVGFNYYFDSEVIGIPIFAHVRSEFLKHSITPFADFKIGYSAGDVEGFYMAPAVGCRFAVGGRFGLSASLGYTLQKAEVGIHYYSSTETIGGFNIKVGFDF